VTSGKTDVQELPAIISWLNQKVKIIVTPSSLSEISISDSRLRLSPVCLQSQIKKFKLLLVDIISETKSQYSFKLTCVPQAENIEDKSESQNAL
jgi:hypothetical protein